MSPCELRARRCEQVRTRHLLSHEHAGGAIGVELAELKSARTLVEEDVHAGDGNLHGKGIRHAGKPLDGGIELEERSEVRILHEARRDLLHNATMVSAIQAR